MIEWERIEAGEYTSKDKRFKISKKSYGYPYVWILYDFKQLDKYAGGIYAEKTLLDCKLKAELETNPEV